MSTERKNIINEIKNAINKRKEVLLKKIPLVHTLNDGIVIRFFNGWEDSEHSDIKYIQVKNYSPDDDKTYYFFLPRGSIFSVKKHDYEETLVCLDGKVQLHLGDEIRMMRSFSKHHIPPQTKHYGIAINDTYMLVSRKDVVKSRKSTSNLKGI